MSEENVPLRVCLLADRLEQPGVGVYTSELAGQLVEDGHAVMIARRAGGLGGRVARPEVDVIEWRMHPLVRSSRLAASQLEAPLRAFGPDVIHATTPRVGRLCRVLASRLELPGVAAVHGIVPGEDQPARSSLSGLAVIALSEAVREDLVNHVHVPKERIRLIYPGVRMGPAPRWDAMGRERTVVLGNVGAMDFVGGHRFLLSALRMLVVRGIDLQLLLAGQGREKPTLRDLVARLALREHVTFVENVVNPRELIEVMDVFVLPTMREGLSPLALEAMALGKPVVVSGVGDAFAAVQHNHTGLVFPKGDADALAAAILRLVTKPDFALRLVHHARELVEEKFGARRMSDETVSLYRKLLSKRKAAAGKEE